MSVAPLGNGVQGVVNIFEQVVHPQGVAVAARVAGVDQAGHVVGWSTVHATTH